MLFRSNAQLLEMGLADRPEDQVRAKTIIEETDRISTVTRKLRDIRTTVVEDYSSSGEQMIDIDKSAREKDDGRAK